jgi:hypothetical protein
MSVPVAVAARSLTRCSSETAAGTLARAVSARANPPAMFPSLATTTAVRPMLSHFATASSIEAVEGRR